MAHEHPLWFSLLYLRHHFTYPLAPFQIELFHLVKQTDHDFIAVMAFRESGKSTIMNLANILWSILGKPGKKFVVIIGETQEQAKSHFLNIKAELENNELLKQDFGPFVENEDDLKRLSLELVYHESKIMAVTREQGIRGLKYGAHRPDLIICDDLEDTSSALDSKASGNLYERLTKEIVPVGSSGTRIIVLGNLFSKHSLMMRLKSDIEEKRIAGIFRTYPLLDDNRKNLWPSKFPNSETIKNLRAKLSNDAWELEYILTFNDDMECEEPPATMPDPLDKKNYLDAIQRRCHFKAAQVLKKYSGAFLISKPQENLIPQMHEFKISAPADWDFSIRWSGDPQYAIYKAYSLEMKKIELEFEEGVQKTIHAYWEAKEKKF